MAPSSTSSPGLSRAQFRIDADTWPRIAQPAHSFQISWGARKAETEFAQACHRANLALSGEAAEAIVFEEALFHRIADAGWLGIAESYMAGEWEARDLSDVLLRLMNVGYHPKAKHSEVGGQYAGLELPDALVRLFSGDGLSISGTMFASGVPTTERIAVQRAKHRTHEPSQYFVDQTTIAPPSIVERADLGDAQLRAQMRLLDMVGAQPGTHVLEYPSASPLLSIAAANRRCTVDCVSADAEYVRSARKVMSAADLDGQVHIELIDAPLLHDRTWRTSYDAIVSVEKLECMDQRTATRYVRSLDQYLAAGGVIALQTVVSTNILPETARTALDISKAYLWPGQHFMSMAELHKLFDVSTNLRISAETHFGDHYAQGLRLQREIFESNARQAAADGFDAVYRRMWMWYLSMKEALFRAGALDAVQLEIRPRNRRGRR